MKIHHLGDSCLGRCIPFGRSLASQTKLHHAMGLPCTTPRSIGSKFQRKQAIETVEKIKRDVVNEDEMKGRWKNESALNSKRRVGLHRLHSKKKSGRCNLPKSILQFLGEIILVITICSEYLFVTEILSQKLWTTQRAPDWRSNRVRSSWKDTPKSLD